MGLPTEYWARKPTSDIGKEALAKVQTFDKVKVLATVYGRQQRAFQYYYGVDPSGLHATSVILRGGDVGELAQVRVNHSRALVITLLNLIVSNKIVWVPKATNVDSDSIKQCELAGAILEYYWSEKNIAAYASRALEDSLVFGEGFVYSEWEENAGDLHVSMPGAEVRTGDLRFHNINSWDVIRDPTKQSWDASDWAIVRRRVNRYDLVAKYAPAPAEDGQPEDPEAQQLRGKIMGAPEDIQPLPRPPQITETDDVVTFTFLHRRTFAMPEGRRVTFLADGTVLPGTDDALEEFPLFRVAPAELTGSSFGYTPFFDVLGMQELMDSLHTSVASNQSTFSAQLIAIEEGSEVPVDQLAGGLKAIYYKPGSKPPEPLNLTKTAPETFAYLKQLKEEQEQLVGLNSVVRGEAPSSEMSGSAMALLDTAALRQSSVLQGNYLRFVQELGQHTLYLIQTFATIPQKIAVVGKGQAHLLTASEFTGKSVSRVKKVTVEIGNPASQTPAGRYSMATELLKLMGPDRLSLESLIQVMTTGQIKPVTESLSSELILIRSENEALLRGENPPVVALDDHKLHAREHRAALANLQVRSNPLLVKAILEHIDEHEAQYFGLPPQTLTFVGQQLPDPNQGPPPQAPGAPAPEGPPPGQPAPGGPPPQGGQQQAGVPNTKSARQPELPQQPQDPRTGQRHDPAAVGQPGPVAPSPTV